MSFVLLGILNSQASGVAQAYFLSVLGGASNEVGNSVAIDSNNNVYGLGLTQSTGQGNNDFLLAKYDSSGSVEWQRTLGGASKDEGYSVAVDSSDNVYVVGETRSTGAGKLDILLAKYDSSGTIQWQRVLGGVSSDYGNGAALDSLGNLYVAGKYNPTDAGGEDEFLLAKYNPSGTVIWQRTLDGASNDVGESVAVDSANNVYIFGWTFSTGAGGQESLLAKYNSSGTLQWQRVLGGAGNDEGYSVAIDSADNVYVLGRTASTGAGSDDFLLAKYNSSGTIQWQRSLGGAGNDEGYSVAIDSADNVYVLGFTNSTGAGDFDFLLAKYNSSGSIQWQRVLGGSTTDRGNSVAVDSLDNVYIFGETRSTGAGNADFFLAKLPNDGSLEGTYSLDGNNFIYQASSLTSATSSLTAATSSLTAKTPSITSATSTLTDASASLTVETIEI